MRGHDRIQGGARLWLGSQTDYTFTLLFLLSSKWCPINLMGWLFCLDNYQNLYCGLFPQQVLAIFFFFFIFFKKKMKNFTKLWVGPITDSLIACI